MDIIKETIRQELGQKNITYKDKDESSTLWLETRDQLIQKNKIQYIYKSDSFLIKHKTLKQ